MICRAFGRRWAESDDLRSLSSIFPLDLRCIPGS